MVNFYVEGLLINFKYDFRLVSSISSEAIRETPHIIFVSMTYEPRRQNIFMTLFLIFDRFRKKSFREKDYRNSRARGNIRLVQRFLYNILANDSILSCIHCYQELKIGLDTFSSALHRRHLFSWCDGLNFKSPAWSTFTRHTFKNSLTWLEYNLIEQQLLNSKSSAMKNGMF